MGSTFPLSALEKRWHDPAHVLKWESDRRAEQRGRGKLQLVTTDSVLDFPLLSGVARSVHAPADARALAHALAAKWESDRRAEQLACRLDGGACRNDETQNARSAFRPPGLIAREGSEWIIVPVARKARPEKLAKAKALYDLRLTAKAQRELACGLLAGEVHCKNGHSFYAPYRCGHRYCLDCGPQTALRLFAKHLPRVREVADTLLAEHSDYVVAKVDFTRRKPCGHRGKCDCPLPDADYNRQLNTFIRRMARAIERKFGITRDGYGMAVHDEIGGGNVNAHAHAVYVGPYIPQRWLSETWRKICADGSFVVSIKHANSVAAALYHATKYPAKFVRESTPERLAQLEWSYHRVRRFRLLGAFDKRVAERVLAKCEQGEDSEAQARLNEVTGNSDSGKGCPYCGAPLRRVPGWRDLDVLIAEGLPSLDAARQEVARIARIHAFGGAGLSPPSPAGGGTKN